MDPNALMVQMLLDRQAEIVTLRGEVEALRAELEHLQSALAQTSREDS